LPPQKRRMTRRGAGSLTLNQPLNDLYQRLNEPDRATRAAQRTRMLIVISTAS
jgi:hypothetical protein